jgi:hypothetical protein
MPVYAGWAMFLSEASLPAFSSLCMSAAERLSESRMREIRTYGSMRRSREHALACPAPYSTVLRG